MISSEEIASTTFFSRAYPKERVNKALPDIALWIQSKQNLDQLHAISKLDPKKYPNLWRVHDGIYDFTNFQHPGGYDFLEMTANTDVTELFESSHPNIEKARALLSKYKIDLPKDISLPPRNTDRLLFEPDGFYCTLRSRIFEVLKTVKTVPYLQSTSFVLDSLLIGYFIVQILSISPFFSPPVSYALALLSGFLLACLANCSHNFWHLRNNWRMYSFDLTCYSSYEWRISHGYSHHTYPNSVLDYEVWAFEPLLYFLPIAGKKNVNFLLPLFFILTVFPVGMFLALLKRLPMILTFQQKFRWEHTLPFINALLLIALRHHFLYSNSDILIYPFQREEVLYVLKHLFIMHSSCSFIFYVLGLGGVHHHPNVWHAGDNPAEAPGNGGKNDKGIDFGIYQLIAVGDRPSVDESLFLSAISFGRHCLHHMFPTIDLCILPQLIPVFNQTCKEFKVEYFISGNEKDENHKRWPKHRSFGMFEGWLGVYQQAVRANVDVTNFPPLETKKNTK